MKSNLIRYERFHELADTLPEKSPAFLEALDDAPRQDLAVACAFDVLPGNRG